MDDLIKICDELENCKNAKICYKNEIICTKSILKRYIGDDHNKLLKLKAELEIHENYEGTTISNLSLLVSSFSLLVAIISGIATLTNSDGTELAVFGLVICIVLLIVLVIIRSFQKRTSSRSRWKKYIAVVVTDMKKE